MHSINNTFFVIITVITTLIIVTNQLTDEENVNDLHEYGERSYYDKSDALRLRFLKSKYEHRKAQILDQLSNNTIYVDGIPHIDVNTVDKIGRIMRMENGFKSMLSMTGVKYIFKRGFMWRTWREINFEGNKTIVCYKCNSVDNTTCKDCLSSGYWIIEDVPPPCPYEILSMSNDNQLCAIHFTQYNTAPTLCPTLINLNDLLSVCNNPIKTEWKITSKYNNMNSEPTLAVICKGREKCDILTIYTILADSIIFRIVNSTNNIMYSRVMKSGQRNYACYESCGILDRQTNTVQNRDLPLVVDLFDAKSMSHKNKREYNTGSAETTTGELSLKTNPLKSLFFLAKSVALYNGNSTGEMDTVDTSLNWSTPDFDSYIKESYTKTPCQKLEEAAIEDDYSDTKEV